MQSESPQSPAARTATTPARSSSSESSPSPHGDVVVQDEQGLPMPSTNSAVAAASSGSLLMRHNSSPPETTSVSSSSNSDAASEGGVNRGVVEVETDTAHAAAAMAELTTTASQESTLSSSSSISTASSTSSSSRRRQDKLLKERNWQSMHNLGGTERGAPIQHVLPRIPARAPLDVAHFQESWSTVGSGANAAAASGGEQGASAPFLVSSDWWLGGGGNGGGPQFGRPTASPFFQHSGRALRATSTPAAAVASHTPSFLERPDRVGYRHSTATAGSTASSTASATRGGDVDVPSTPSAAAPASSSSFDLQAPGYDSSGISSIIHDAARIANWDHVLELCQSHPEAAAYINPSDGWTALHHACNRRCPYPHVVKALIECYPRALSIQDKQKWGWVPLHYAARFKAPKQVVHLLLHQCPERGLKTVSKKDRMGRTPLFYAIRYEAPPGVVGLLLQVDPSVVLEEDQNADSPLALVWDSWAEKLEGKRVVNSFLPGGFPEPEDRSVEERAKILRSRLQRDTKLRKRWNKANVLLKAAFGFSVDSADEDYEEQDADDNVVASSAGGDASSRPRKWRIVHATAAVKCHLSLFLLACALHPEQVQELDEYDLRRPGDPHAADVNPRQTALHLAASSNAGGEPGKTVLLTLLSQYRDAAQVPDGIDESLPLHRMVENPRKKDWTNHAAILYRFYPRAVQIPDLNGKLPLHRAAAAVSAGAAAPASDEESVILQLLRVFPQAALHADHSGLLPLHSLAAHSATWDSGVEAVYNIHRNAVLVRAGPKHYNRLPLHMAAASATSQEPLLSRLLLHHPRAASMPDSQGKLPLFLACELGKSWNEGGTRVLHAAFPNALQAREDNARGWLPLHAAAAAPRSDADLIERLVENYADAASTPDARGRYPLHLACAAGKSWIEGGISFLFDVDPSPMSAVDDRGYLPFHCAALHHCLTGPSDDGLMDPDDDECEIDFTAQERADRRAQAAAHVDILFNLLRADPTVLEGSTFP